MKIPVYSQPGPFTRTGENGICLTFVDSLLGVATARVVYFEAEEESISVLGLWFAFFEYSVLESLRSLIPC